MEDITVKETIRMLFSIGTLKISPTSRRPRDAIEWQNLHDHLLAAEERVANELARAQSYGLLFVRHVDVCDRVIRKPAYDDCIETDVGRVVVDEAH
jgi:hypothetical protein